MAPTSRPHLLVAQRGGRTVDRVHARAARGRTTWKPRSDHGGPVDGGGADVASRGTSVASTGEPRGWPIHPVIGGHERRGRLTADRSEAAARGPMVTSATTGRDAGGGGGGKGGELTECADRLGSKESGRRRGLVGGVARDEDNSGGPTTADGRGVATGDL